MLMNVDVRDELKKIVDAIKAAGAAAERAPEVASLFATFDEIPRLKETLLTKLQTLLDAIDSGGRQELDIRGLSDAVIKAMQELEAPGGPPGIGDNLH